MKKVVMFTMIAGAIALLAFANLAIFRTASAAVAAQVPAFEDITGMELGRGPGGPGGPGGRGGQRGGPQQDEQRQTDLAAALGISVEELQAAHEQARAAAIAEAVEQDLITQVQADEMAANGKGSPFAGRLNGWLAEKGIDFNALLADALGISVDDLAAAREAAKDAALDRAVEAGDMTQEQADLMKAQQALYGSEAFRTAMDSAFDQAVAAAVSAGAITQAQADLILEAQANKPAGGPGAPGGPGGRSGPGGGRP